VYELAQIELERRKTGDNRHSGSGLFASRIKCGCCGSWFGSKVWHSNTKYKRTIYQCNAKFKNGEKCTTPHLTEEEIKSAFISAANKLIADKQSIVADFREFETVLFDMADLNKEHGDLSTDLAVTAELIQKCIAENARVALDQAEYQKRYDGLVGRFETTKARLAEVDEQISQKRSRKEVFRRFIADLEKQDGVLTDFDNSLWCSLVDFATVGSNGKTDFTFKNGLTITA
ncbi:MAG: zinc ribbon domain-containing protein, partial [Clostridiales bacterium]|nr:zinc ribbon domain-containing protein [Clostridiales bacterium]